MMTHHHFAPGDLVTMLAVEWQGLVGVVSQAITEDHPGHILVYKDDCIFGVQAAFQDVVPADANSQGFAQLAYHLIKLGSHVIEQRLII